MKRFTKDKLIEHITYSISKLQRKPTIEELTYFINVSLDINTIGSYDELFKYVVSYAMIEDYINKYDLSDWIKGYKRKYKNYPSNNPNIIAPQTPGIQAPPPTGTSLGIIENKINMTDLFTP